MTTKRFTRKILASMTLLAGLGTSAAAAVPPPPKAEEMASVVPKQTDVSVAIVAPADVSRCRVVAYPTADNPVGYVLVDSGNKPLRRMLAVGAENFNIVSFYLDGQEVYRETDTKNRGKADQYRWLGVNGSKLGVDIDGDGTIDTWDAISPEEVSQEVFEAVVKNDTRRLQAVVITPGDLQAMGLPASEAAKLQARSAQANAKLQATSAALKLTDKARWIHVELWAPETTPADSFGGKMDIVRHRNAGVLVDKGDKTADTFQVGEMVQVGRAWRVIDGPSTGVPVRESGDGGMTTDVPSVVQAEVAELGKLKYSDYAERAAVLNKIVAKLQNHPQQEVWLRQLLDAYVSAAEAGDKASETGLFAWKAQIEKIAPKAPIAAFATFRAMGVEYSGKLKAADTAAKVGEAQKWWREQLEEFVKNFPNLDETPEALFRLAMATEFMGKDGETAAKKHYTTLAKTFNTHPLAPQAIGAVKRLDSEGQPIQLAGPTVGTGEPMDVASLKDTVVVVYFWGSFHTRLKDEATTLRELEKRFAGKPVKIVTVTLDTSVEQAMKAIKDTNLPGTHLFSPNSALATSYGIMGPHVLLIGKDGKVANKNAQPQLLVDEIERLLK